MIEGKKLRLVLDLRYVNKHIKHKKFRHKNLSALSEMLNKGDYFTTFNLRSGYHHIEIHREHRKFLGFEWTFQDGSTKYFQFCVHHSAWHQHVMSLQTFFSPSPNDGGGGVLKPLFILMTALQHFEVLKSLNPLVNLIETIFFLLGL